MDVNRSDVVPSQPNNRTPVKKNNPYLPNEPKKLVTQQQKEQFLEILGRPEVHGYVSVACKIAKIGRTTAYERMKDDSHFASAVTSVRDKFEEDTLVELEQLSEMRAKDPKATTERIFQLNALRPEKYKPKPQAPQLPALTINFGVRIPKLPGLREVPGDIEVTPAPPRRVAKKATQPPPEDTENVDSDDLDFTSLDIEDL